MFLAFLPQCLRHSKMGNKRFSSNPCFSELRRIISRKKARLLVVCYGLDVCAHSPIMIIKAIETKCALENTVALYIIQVIMQ